MNDSPTVEESFWGFYYWSLLVEFGVYSSVWQWCIWGGV